MAYYDRFLNYQITLNNEYFVDCWDGFELVQGYIKLIQWEQRSISVS